MRLKISFFFLFPSMLRPGGSHPLPRFSRLHRRLRPTSTDTYSTYDLSQRFICPKKLPVYHPPGFLVFSSSLFWIRFSCFGLAWLRNACPIDRSSLVARLQRPDPEVPSTEARIGFLVAISNAYRRPSGSDQKHQACDHLA